MHPAEARGELPQRALEPQPLQLPWTQGRDGTPQLLYGPLRDLLRLRQFRIQLVRNVAPHHLQLQPQQQQALRSVIVQLAANPPALLLFGMMRRHLQPPHLALRAGALDGFMASLARGLQEGQLAWKPGVWHIKSQLNERCPAYREGPVAGVRAAHLLT